jgi:hypothetical protein
MQNQDLNPSSMAVRPAVFFLFFFGGTVILMQGFVLAKQALYHLCHTSSPFCSGYFGDGVSELFAQAGL